MTLHESGCGQRSRCSALLSRSETNREGLRWSDDPFGPHRLQKSWGRGGRRGKGACRSWTDSSHFVVQIEHFRVSPWGTPQEQKKKKKRMKRRDLSFSHGAAWFFWAHFTANRIPDEIVRTLSFPFFFLAQWGYWHYSNKKGWRESDVPQECLIASNALRNGVCVCTHGTACLCCGSRPFLSSHT